MRTKKIVILLCVILLAMSNTAFALEKLTHSYLNEGIALNWWGGFPLDSYLKNNLNISGGVQSYYNGEQAWNWMADGGAFEDEPMYTRSMNHFHDPLKDWGSAGFKGVGISSAVWAQYPLQTQNLFGNFSWNDTRSYYYWALTAPSATSQANFYSLCFRGLGQLMHLVQDASVPAHTRNDFHYIYNYEDWIESMRTSTNPADQAEFNSIMNTPAIPLSPYLLSRVGYNSYATIPIAGLFDTDSYNGSNPGITPFNSVGLTEYTNANFFSEDTIFSSDYRYPAYSSATIMDLPIGTEEGMTIYRPYYYKTGEGDAGYPLATDGYLGWYVHNYIPAYDYLLLTNLKDQALDEQCYDAYARRLLPDAIAYSSALLGYFFRGQIDAVNARTITDSNGNITGMTLKVKNNTTGEPMTNGKFVVSYGYQDSVGNTVYGCSGEVPFTGSIPPGNDTSTDTYKYSFAFPSSIPSDAKSTRYMLVYRGPLGLENGAVAAKHFVPNLIIDDWENGQNWVTQNRATTLSLEQTPALVFKGNASLNMGLANAYAETYYGQPYYNAASDISPTSEIKALGQAGLSFPSPTTITRVAFYVLPGWNTANLSEDTVARIYANTGPYPGKLIAESQHVIITPTNMGLLWYKFDPAVKMPLSDYSSFNITFEPVGGSGAPLVVYLYTNGGYYFQGQQLRLLSTGWTIDANCDMSMLWATQAPPLASLNKAVDLSGSNNLSIAVWSTNLTGNVINLQYGIDKDHLKTMPIGITQTAKYQIFKIPLSNLTDDGKDMNLANIGYFAITLGKDGCADDGKYKANTIYIDQLEAE